MSIGKIVRFFTNWGIPCSFVDAIRILEDYEDYEDYYEGLC